MSAMNNATSFHMRFWWEREDEESDMPVLRGMLRNLRTGEEQLVGDVNQLDEYMKRLLESGAVLPGDRAGAGA